MLSRYSVKKPYTVIVGIILVIVLGVISFMNMSTDLLPAMELPYVVVYTTYVGATPEQVESEVTRPMEASMATVGNVKNITSTSADNVASVIMEFNSGTNMDTALIEISSKLDQLSGSWPTSVGSPIVMKINPDMMPVSVVSVSDENMDILELSKYVEDEIVQEYESIAGVASATAMGLIEQQISVTIDQSRIDVLNSAILKEIDEQLSEVEAQLTEAQAQLSDGKRELARQRSLILGQIDAGLSQFSSSEGQIAEAISQLEAQRSELQGQLDQVNAALEAMDALPDLTDRQREQLNALLTRLESLNAQREQLRERLSGSDESLHAQLIKEREDALQQREALVAERKAYQEYLEDLNAGNPEVVRENLSSLQKSKSEIEAEIAGKSASLDALRAEAQELQSRINALSGGEAEATAEATDAPANEDAEAPTSEATAEPMEEEAEAAWIAWPNARAESAEDAHQGEKAALEAELQKKNAEIAALEGELQEANARLTDIESQIAKLNATLSELEGGMTEEERAARKAEAQAAVDQLSDRIEQLDRQIALLDAAIAGEQTILNEEVKAELLRQLEALNAAIQEIEESEAYAAVKMLADKEGAEAQYVQLTEAKAQLEAGIQMIDATLGKLNAGIIPGGMIPGIDEDTSLADARVALETARQQALAGFAEAEAQIAAGEDEIASAWTEFQDAREEAFQQANLSGVITMEMVSGILGAQNFSMPAGYAHEDGVDYMVRVGDKITSVEALKNLKLFSLGLDSIDDVRLVDVARVELTDNRDEVFTKVDGRDGVLLSFQKQSTYSTADVAHDVTAKSEALMAKDPSLRVVELFNQGTYIDLVVNSVLENLLYGAILAVAVLLLFLMDVRPTIIIAFSIPVSVVAAFVAMYFTGITLNVISLAGLALGVGMLVDNSIVVIDNIYRLRQEEHMPILRACVEGAKQVSGAIAASTLTTISVFLPIVFTSGMARQLFTDMGLTIAYSLLASLLVAMTVVPSMSAGILKNARTRQPRFFIWLQNAYAGLLRRVLKIKPIVLLVAVALLTLTGWQALQMGMVFMPEVSSEQMTATLYGEPDDTFEISTDRAMLVMNEIMEVEGVSSVGVASGGTTLLSRASSGSGMTFYIMLEENNGRTNRQIADEISARGDALGVNLSVSASTMDISMLTGEGISIEVVGPELTELRSIATEVADLLSEVPGAVDIDNGLGTNAPELTVTVDKEKAIDNGLTVAQVYQYIAGRLYGAAEVTQMNVDGKSLAVTVVDDQNLNIRPSDIADMEIESVMGEETRYVRIGDIAEIQETESMSSISRKAQQRLVTVSCAVDEDHNITLVARDVEDKLSGMTVPEGYTVSVTGESEIISETMRDLILMILLAIVFIFLIMVAQFQSFKSPAIVMFTIPLAFTGGIAALLLFGMELSIVSMLGFLVLAGVIVNNGIVFVDSVNQLRIAGMDKKEAIIETGRLRLRPILMTAMTTILGMFTMALGTGQGAEMMQPMAIVTIGGLLYATLMTLFVVPCLYDLINGEKMRAREITMREEELNGADIARDAPVDTPTPDTPQAAAAEEVESAVKAEGAQEPFAPRMPSGRRVRLNLKKS